MIVLAEEAIPMADFDVAALDQRIRDTEEDLVAAKTDAERARVAEQLDHLRQFARFSRARSPPLKSVSLRLPYGRMARLVDGTISGH